MADGYGRASGRLAACSVHQGPGLTNTVTGLTEAAKSRTPLIVLAPEMPAAAIRSNFRIDQVGLVEAVGAIAERVHGPATALADVARAVRRARVERRAVVLMLPLDVQAAAVPRRRAAPPPTAPRRRPAPRRIRRGARWPTCSRGARRPAIIAGRGAVLADAGAPLCALGELTGALLATSAVANGLFVGDPFDLGISGRLRDPAGRAAAGGGRRGGRLRRGRSTSGRRATARCRPRTRRVVQVDLDAEAIGAHRPVALGVIGDAAATARGARWPRSSAAPWTAARGARPPWRRRSPARRWRDEPYAESETAGVLDPRTLSIALDDLLPARAHRRRGLRRLHGLAVDVPARARRGGLRLPAGLPVRRPRAGQRHRGGDRAARPPDGRGAGRRRRAALAARVRDARAPGPADPRRHLRRRGLRRRGPPLRPDGRGVDLAQFPDTDFAALARAAGLPRPHGALARRPRRPARRGSPPPTGLRARREGRPRDLRRMARRGLPDTDRGDRRRMPLLTDLVDALQSGVAPASSTSPSRSASARPCSCCPSRSPTRRA